MAVRRAMMRPMSAAVHSGETRRAAISAAFAAVVGAWLLLLTIFCWKLDGLAADDMYITYRYAQNLLAGNGLTFNPGERVFGISDPGVAMLLAGGAALTGLPIPAVGTILTAASLLVLAGALLWEGGRRGRFAEAAAGGTLVVTSSFLWLGQGAGPLVALAGLALAALLAERYPVAAGIAGGLAAGCRPDAVIGCGLLAALLYGRTKRLPVAFAASVLLVCAAGVGAARAYFGRFIPSTVAAKQSFAARDLDSFTGLRGFWGRALETFKFAEGGWGQILLPLAALGLVLFYRRSGLAGRLVLAYGTTLALLKIPFSFWYVGPTAVVVFLGAPFAVGGAARWAGRRFGTTGVALVVLIALAAVGWPLVAARVTWLRQGYAGDWRRAAYQAAGEWLARNAPPDGDVAFGEVGLLGYYSQRPVLDLVGLITPSSIPFTAAGDQVGAFLVKPTRYVLRHTADPRGGTRPIFSRPWFPRCYRERVTLRLPKFGVSVILYERIPGSTVPPPRPPVDQQAASG
jgi:hypothetical protein